MYFILADRPDHDRLGSCFSEQGLPDVHAYYNNFLRTQLENYVKLNLAQIQKAKFLSKIIDVPFCSKSSLSNRKLTPVISQCTARKISKNKHLVDSYEINQIQEKPLDLSMSNNIIYT